MLLPRLLMLLPWLQVWGDESREKLCGTVQKMMTLHFKEQVNSSSKYSSTL